MTSRSSRWGLANIHAEVRDVDANKDKILRAARIFEERGVNIGVFPEFCLSGYFWDEREDCLAYMKEAVAENHAEWIENELQPLVGGDLEALVLNGLTATQDKDRFLNRTFAVGRDSDYLTDENTYDKVFLPGIEKSYTESGRDDRLVLPTRHGRLGFTTCYDYLFSELLREFRLVCRVAGFLPRSLPGGRADARVQGAGGQPSVRLRSAIRRRSRSGHGRARVHPAVVYPANVANVQWFPSGSAIVKSRDG